MSQTNLCFLGLPHGQWADAFSVFQWPAAAVVMRATDTALLNQAVELAAAEGDYRFVIAVEHPARVLAKWLNRPASSVGGEAAVKAETLQALVQLETLLQAHAGRCMVVDLEDVLRHGQAFAAKLGQWLGAEVEAKGTPWVPVLHPVPLTLASRWVAADLSMSRAYERLYARCLVLTGDAAPSTTSMRPDTPTVIEHAVRQYGLLLAGHAALSRQAAAGQSASIDVMLQARLHETQAELEALFLATAGKSPNTLLAGPAARQAPPPPDEMRELQRRNRLLQVQLHQVQEELEGYFTESQGMRKDAGRGALAPSWVGIHRVTRSGTRDAAPHRELSLVLQSVAAADRQHPSLDVRLVEHHGRPGIVFFDTGSAARPLMAWQPSGQEDGRPFMLLLPGDDPSREVLRRLGSGDWQFVCGVAAAVMLHLREASGGVMTPWLMVASRLVKQLGDLPPRFRFDAVDVAADEAQPDAVRVIFQRPIFGQDAAERLELRWRPRASGGGAVELLPTDARSALNLFAAWPLDPSGSGLAAWNLPVAGTDTARQFSEWQGMSALDRGRLLSLLDALPAAAMKAAEVDLGSAWHGIDLSSAARAQFREAHRLVHGSRFKRVVRAALGRVAE